MSEIKIKKIKDKEKIEAICQSSQGNCSLSGGRYWQYLDCKHDCPNTPHNQAYKDTRW